MCFDGEKKLKGRKLRVKKFSTKKYSGFVFSLSMFGWKKNEMKGIWKENWIFVVGLCRKVKENKEIMIQNDISTLMLVQKVFQLYQ